MAGLPSIKLLDEARLDLTEPVEDILTVLWRCVRKRVCDQKGISVNSDERLGRA
jgi:hypothetical protein